VVLKYSIQKLNNRDSSFLLVSFLFLCYSGPLMNIFLLEIIPSQFINTLIPLFKDFILSLALILILVNSKSRVRKKAFWLFALSFSIVLIASIYSSANIASKVINIRRVVYIPILIIFGYYLNYNFNKLKNLIRLLIRFIVVFGFIELILNRILWLGIFDILKYYSNASQEYQVS
jgi:hypothetical protein